MSALSITIKTLLAGAPVTAIVGQRVYPGFAPQNAGYPNIIVHKIYGAEEVLLQGASQWPNARMSIECRTEGDAAVLDTLGEAVVDWLRDKHLYVIDGCEVTFLKEGTDENTSSNIAQNGVPLVVARVIDYNVRYRRL